MQQSGAWWKSSSLTQPSSPLLMWIAVVVIALALALLPLQLVLTLIGGVLAVLLVLAQPVFGLYLAVLSVPIQEMWYLPGGLSYTQAAFALAAGAWGLRVLAHPEQRIIKGRLFVAWCALLWALLLSSAWTPYSTSLALKETLRWAEAFGVWLIAVNMVRQRWQIIGLVACVLLAPAAEALLGLYQFATGDGPPSFRIAASLPFVRAYGTHGQPNSFAGYMNMVWPLAVSIAVAATWRWLRPTTNDQRPTTNDQRPTTNDQRPMTDGPTTDDPIPNTQHPVPHVIFGSIVAGSWLIVGVLLAALVASFSRGAWLGAVAGLFGMALALGRRARWGVGALVVLVVLVLVASGAGVLPGALAARINSITSSFTYFDPSTVQITSENFAKVERMAHIQAGLRMVAAHPITGVGPGNFSPAFQDVASPPWYVSRGHAHNYYLHMAAEAGIIGLLAYLLLIGGVAYQARALLRRPQPLFERCITIGCCGIIAAVAGHNLFENLHALSMGIQLAAVWALINQLGLRKQEPRTED